EARRARFAAPARPDYLPWPRGGGHSAPRCAAKRRKRGTGFTMAKARAIVKRRKAVRNIKKITKTMQMIATAKFQKSLKRAVGSKPYTQKIRELVSDLARTVGRVEHPLLRRPSAEDRTGKVVLVVITSNRGLAGAYNGNVLRKSNAFVREREAAGETVELQVIGKKGIS